MSVVAFVGSRSFPSVPGPLPGGAWPPALVPALVGSVLAGGRSLVVGCSVGVDAAVVSAALAAGAASRLSVLSVFGPCGAGAAGPLSSVAGVRAAARAGAAVSWSVPGFSGPGALAVRSRAVVAAAVAGGPGSGLVAVVGSVCPGSVSPARRSSWWAGSGSGSWSAVACAVASGLPVVVFGGGPLPAWAGGSWLPAAASGPWASGWLWVPQPPLFGAPAGAACHNVAAVAAALDVDSPDLAERAIARLCCGGVPSATGSDAADPTEHEAREHEAEADRLEREGGRENRRRARRHREAAAWARAGWPGGDAEPAAAS